VVLFSSASTLSDGPISTAVTTVVLTIVALLVNVVQAYFWTYSSATGDCHLRPQVMPDITSFEIAAPFLIISIKKLIVRLFTQRCMRAEITYRAVTHLRGNVARETHALSSRR